MPTNQSESTHSSSEEQDNGTQSVNGSTASDNAKRKNSQKNGSKNLKKAKIETQQNSEVQVSDNSELIEELSGKARILVQGYFEQLICMNELRNKMGELKKQFTSSMEFLFLFHTNYNTTFLTSQEHNDDAIIQWYINELEYYIEQFPAYEKMSAKHAERIESLIKTLCLSKKILTPVLNSTKIKEIMRQHYPIQLTLNYFTKYSAFTQSPQDFLQEFIPENVTEQLKKQAIFSENKTFRLNKTFLDLLLEKHHQHILYFWQQGFKPKSQIQFNEQFFSYAGTADTAADYKQMADNDTYNEFFVFSKRQKTNYLFIDNDLIDVALFEKLYKKEKMKLLNQAELMCLLADKEDKISKNLLNKIIFNLEQLEFSDAFCETYKSWPKLNEIASFFRRLQLYAHKKITNMDELLQLKPDPTFSDQILLLYAKLITEYPLQIKKLVAFLKSKQVNSAQIFGTLFLRGFIETAQVDLQSSKDKFITFKNEYHELFVELAKDISSEEMIKIIDNITLFQLKLAKQLEAQYPSELSKQSNISNLINYSAFITSELCKYSLSQKFDTSMLYKHLSELLRIQCNLGSNKTNIIKQHVEFIEPFTKELATGVLAHRTQTFIDDRIKLPQYNLLTLNQLIEINTTHAPDWFGFFLQIKMPYLNKTFDIFSYLLSGMLSKNDDVVRYYYDSINCLFQEMSKNKELLLPLNFLDRVAQMQIDVQENAKLSEKAKVALKELYNKCIHLVQGTPQEQTFDDIRTQLLIRFDADHTKDPQAIHTQENHAYSDKIFAEMYKAISDSQEEFTQNVTLGIKAFYSYLNDEKEKELHRSIPFKDDADKLFALLKHMQSVGVPQDIYNVEFNEINTRIKNYPRTVNYIKQTEQKMGVKLPSTATKAQIHAVNDAKKLYILIAMIGYYSREGIANPFITNGPEALNIMRLELFDQINNPSCDQGPFMRILMALEPASNIKFPRVTRRGIHSLIKNYINNYFDQLSTNEKDAFIQEIYVMVNDKETLEQIESIPADALNKIAILFLKENEGRLGFLSAKEIEQNFAYERPNELHPEIAQYLNQHHQREQSKKLTNGVNAFGFFANNSNHPDDTEQQFLSNSIDLSSN